MIRKISFIAGLLLIIGLIGSIITFSSIQRNSDSITTQIDDVPFSHLKVDVNNVDIELVPSEGEVKIDVSGANSQELMDGIKIDQQEDTLIIQSNHKRIKWFSFGFDSSSKIKLFLPEKEYKKVELNSHSGDVYLANITGKDIQTQTRNGDIVANNISSQLFTVKTTSGDISLETIKADIHTKTTNGDTTLSNVKAKSIQTASGNGDILLKDVSGEIQAENKNGDFTVKNQQITDPITAQARTGDILITAENYPENVQFETASKVGDILIFGKNQQTINNQNPGILIHLETTVGDIIVKRK
ncbi:DUF4097 family beta strand repeat-containing protein [Lederbergia galactosidilytica]|uniref:DUF4097 domain-containing protein n=1 Tax=Lederbergia galactosidilytica TaxID=217031 RepID=A0A0Q9Y7U2_9BACI|nr:DUF4097 family beta strand repeat-containing protein [Lederbergia galactosidilytica]KRG14903.1 hypothetical protein ACA30_09560 [Virgibacillus soli]KRG16909.1 hypothetical protein ACA29_02215 [Lederbergia galactosidilytica]MBP1917348.1 DUF4097 and DUF4098 domain-containing protein YvlB [Lederbergia galactosidilytica]OAK69152.1 hypothetical protein ABB05_14425 [Lederbergia galactosidilytica]